MTLPHTFQLTASGVEVLGQLFVNGPTWDGNICDKSGRAELVKTGLAFRLEGFTALTEDGLRTAIEWKNLDPTSRWSRKIHGA